MATRLEVACSLSWLGLLGDTGGNCNVEMPFFTFVFKFVLFLEEEVVTSTATWVAHVFIPTGAWKSRSNPAYKHRTSRGTSESFSAFAKSGSLVGFPGPPPMSTLTFDVGTMLFGVLDACFVYRPWLSTIETWLLWIAVLVTPTLLLREELFVCRMFYCAGIVGRILTWSPFMALSSPGCTKVARSSFDRNCLNTLSKLSWPSFTNNMDASTSFFHSKSIWYKSIVHVLEIDRR